jgi:undecaprenyl-phosphate 4-deoxy-4-formamido-L-arabinose transferase
VKLVGLWLNMFLNFSILPLRLATWTGLITSLISVLLFVMVFVDKFYIDPSAKPGIPTVLCTLVFFGGLNLLIAGMLGEYLGRLYLDQTGTPQFVVRYVRPRTGAGPRSEPGAVLQTASEMDGLHHPRQPGPRAEPAPHELVPVP